MATTRDPLSDAKKTRIEKDYTVGDEIGRGAYAVVKKGIDLKSNDEVAIKVARRSAAEDVLSEVVILRSINHPRICNLRDVYETSKHLYLVLDLATGGELFDKIVELSNYSEEDARQLFFNLMEVLQHLESKSIIHRDLKPENLLLKSPQDPITEIKVADFGCAIFRAPETKYDRAGTPGYMAPEVLDGKSYDNKADCFSAGVILYILLCGFPPFEADDFKMKWEFLSPEWDEISPEAKDLVSKLLKLDPAERIPIDDVLHHPWLTAARPEARALAATQKALRKFQAKRRLKKGILAVQSINRMKNLLKTPRNSLTESDAHEISELPDAAQNFLKKCDLAGGGLLILKELSESSQELTGQSRDAVKKDPRWEKIREAVKDMEQQLQILKSNLELQ